MPFFSFLLNLISVLCVPLIASTNELSCVATPYLDYLTVRIWCEQISNIPDDLRNKFLQRKKKDYSTTGLIINFVYTIFIFTEPCNVRWFLFIFPSIMSDSIGLTLFAFYRFSIGRETIDLLRRRRSSICLCDEYIPWFPIVRWRRRPPPVSPALVFFFLSLTRKPAGAGATQTAGGFGSLE